MGKPIGSPMKILFLIILCLACSTESRGHDSVQAPSMRISKPVFESQHSLYLADPCVLHYKGYYYIYGTDDLAPDVGIPVYRSKDLTHWEGPLGKRNGYALLKGDVYGDRGFWAPYVVVKYNRLYMFYTANEHIAVATSDSPLGPFIQQDKQPFPSDSKEIDPYVSLEKNGNAYLYFDRLDNGNRIFFEQLAANLISRKTDTRVECIHATEPWENTAHAPWAVTEASCVVTHGGWRYLLYTSNDFRNKDYSVGYATSRSPQGPWTKYSGNPILRQDAIVQGPGSCDLIKAARGEWYLFYHVHGSSQELRPVKIAFSKCRFVTQPGSAPPVLIVDPQRNFAYSTPINQPRNEVIPVQQTPQ